MVVDHVERDRDAVDVAEVDQRLQLSRSRSNVLSASGGKPFAVSRPLMVVRYPVRATGSVTT